VLNVVQGRGAVIGDALIHSSEVDRITFTGSTAVGRLVGAAAGQNLVPVTLELGGKGASIVLDDADLDLAAATAARAVFNNTGQVCLAGTRVLVQRSVYDEFLRRFAEQAAQLRVGDPLDPSTDLGPLASEKQFDRVSRYFALAQSEGGTVLGGGQERAGRSSRRLSPTSHARAASGAKRSSARWRPSQRSTNSTRASHLPTTPTMD
jgi:acyl-CoA reductase-like NAD-dependent aldehyde dehydrogenase